MDLKLSHCFITVDDQEQALTFYRDVLGLQVINDVSFEGLRWITVSPPSQPGVEIGLATPNVSQLWHPFGQLPIDMNYDGTITSVDAGSDAARAGLQPGDRFDLGSMTLDERMIFLDIHYPRPGDRFTLSLRAPIAGVAEREVTLTAEARPTISEDFITLLRRSTYVVFVGIAAVVLLLRPNRMTWAFYLYSLAAIYGNGEYFGFLPPLLFLTISEVQNVLLALGNSAFLTFSARFPSDRTEDWSIWSDRIAPYAFVLLALTSVGADVGAAYFGMPSQRLEDASNALKVVVFTLALATLFHMYFGRRGQERQRLKLVVAAVVVAYAANVLILWIDTFSLSFDVAFWWDALGALNLFIPLAVAYGVLRYRVMDVNFILSRALVYGALTTALVALFALIDWFIGTVLTQTRLAVAVNLAVAVAIGVSLNGIHHRAEKFIASLLFRKRHAAARKLAHIATVLPHATNGDAIAALVVEQPASALSLTSGALFRRDERGWYQCVSSVGWPQPVATELDPRDPLLSPLREEEEPLRVSVDLATARDDMPRGDAMPVFAVPIIVRHELEAVALYGAHTGGEDLDPDETSALARIGSAAGAAYYHLEADSLRGTVEALGREIESWRARAIELGWSEAPFVHDHDDAAGDDTHVARRAKLGD